MMSGSLAVLQKKMSSNPLWQYSLRNTDLDSQMERFIYGGKSDSYIIHLKRTWEKLLLAALVIVSIENLADVMYASSWNPGRPAGLKCAAAMGATPVAGRFPPGTLPS